MCWRSTPFILQVVFILAVVNMILVHPRSATSLSVIDFAAYHHDVVLSMYTRMYTHRLHLGEDPGGF